METPQEHNPLDAALADMDVADVITTTSAQLSMLQSSVDTMRREEYLKRRDSSDVETRIQATLMLPPWEPYMDLFPKLFEDPEPRVRAALVENNLYAHTLFASEFAHLYRDPDPLVRLAVINHPLPLLQKDPRLLKLYLEDSDPMVQDALIKSGFLWQRLEAESRKSQKAHFLKYRDSSDVEMRVTATSFWWFAHEDLFPKLFSDPDHRVRIALATNDWAESKFPAQHQELFHDSNPQVRIAMIETHGMFLWQNPQLVKELLKDQDVQVRAALIKRWRPSWGSTTLVRRLMYSREPAIANAVQQNRYLRSFIEQDLPKQT